MIIRLTLSSITSLLTSEGGHATANDIWRMADLGGGSSSGSSGSQGTKILGVFHR